MTAPNGPIIFNNSTGSDTQASGLGPATAVFGSGASTTSASAVVTGIDTAGVTAGDLLFVDSLSGRKFSIIASVDSSTQVTCDDNFSNTESDVIWAIGGKRRNWATGTSRFLNRTDIKAGWSVDIEHTGTTYLANSDDGGDLSNTQISIGGNTTDGPVRIFSSSSEKPILSATFGGAVAFVVSLNAGFVVLENLHLQTAAGSVSPQCLRINGGSGESEVRNCILDNSVGGGSILSVVNNISMGLSFIDCFMTGGLSFGNTGVEANPAAVINCVVQGLITVQRYRSPRIINSICKGIRLAHSLSSHHTIANNVIYDASDSGILFETSVIARNSIVENNIIVNSGGFGINFSASKPRWDSCKRNAFFNNSSGNRSNLDPHPEDITLTADPFVDAAAGDFNINNTAGGGALLRESVFALPETPNTNLAPFRQWLDPIPSGGGGGFYISQPARMLR